MIRFSLFTAIIASTLAAVPAEARVSQQAPRVLKIQRAAGFLTVLDRDGTLSAGWINVLPVLATACNMRIDNGQLTSRLIDLSQDTGNISYTRDLYTRLYMIEKHRAENSFVRAWTAQFSGRQKEACDTAEALWGDGGNQFPGILKREAMNDGAGSAPSGTPPNNCK